MEKNVDGTKDPGLEAFLKQIKETVEVSATSDASTVPEDAIPLIPASEPNTLDSSPKTEDGDGGKGGGNNGEGKGGGAGGFKKFMNDLGFFQRLIVGLLVLLLFAVAMNEISLWFTGRLIKTVEGFNANPQSKIINSTSAKDSVTFTEEKQAQPKTIIYASTFDCTTDEKKESGYAMKNIQSLNGVSESLQVPPGCVLVKVSESINKFEGKGYQLAVAVPHIPGNFWKCGDAGGKNDSPSDCVSFINSHLGREMRIAVLNGGYVKIN